MPAETAVAAAPVGWVYRAEEEMRPARRTSAPKAHAWVEDEVEETADSEGFGFGPVAAVGLFFVGMGTMGVVSMTALALLPPVWLARKFTNSD